MNLIYDDDDLNNPLIEDNWFFQTRGKFMKYVIYNGHTITHKHVNKNPVRPFTKANPYHKHHIGEGESATSTGLSEDAISGTPTESSENSIQIERLQVPTIFIKSRHDNADSSIVKPMVEFEPPQENGEQITVKDNNLLTTNLTVEIQNQKGKGS